MRPGSCQEERWLDEQAPHPGHEPGREKDETRRHRCHEPQDSSAPRGLGACETAAVEQRVTLVTLGVHDLERARRFYEALGWRTNAAAEDDVVFFQAGGMIVSLWSRDQLAEDTGVEDAGGWGGITLAYNTRSPEEVDAVIAEAEAAGGTVLRPGVETFWGGYSGAFADPEGHAWEVAHNPHWTLADDGSIRL